MNASPLITASARPSLRPSEDAAAESAPGAGAAGSPFAGALNAVAARSGHKATAHSTDGSSGEDLPTAGKAPPVPQPVPQPQPLAVAVAQSAPVPSSVSGVRAEAGNPALALPPGSTLGSGPPQWGASSPLPPSPLHAAGAAPANPAEAPVESADTPPRSGAGACAAADYAGAAQGAAATPDSASAAIDSSVGLPSYTPLKPVPVAGRPAAKVGDRPAAPIGTVTTAGAGASRAGVAGSTAMHADADADAASADVAGAAVAGSGAAPPSAALPVATPPARDSTDASPATNADALVAANALAAPAASTTALQGYSGASGDDSGDSELAPAALPRGGATMPPVAPQPAVSADAVADPHKPAHAGSGTAWPAAGDGSGMILPGANSSVGASDASLAPTAPAPTLRVHASIDSADFAQGLSERVSWMVENGVNGAKLQVNPPQLGPIELRIAVQGDHAHIWMTTHSAVARDALQSGAPQLKEMLGAQGFGQVSVDISQRSFQDRSAYAPPYQRESSAEGRVAPSASRVEDSAPRRLSALDAYA